MFPSKAEGKVSSQKKGSVVVRVLWQSDCVSLSYSRLHLYQFQRRKGYDSDDDDF